MGFSKLFDSAKGSKNPHKNRTICELQRELYDLCVTGLHDKDPELMFKMIKILEDAFIMGVKMNRKLVRHKLGSSSKWKKSEYRNKEIDRKELAKKRKERKRLVRLLEENDKVLEEYDKEKKTKKKKKDKK